MVVSIIGATVFGMVEIGKVTAKLSENTIRLSLITDQVTQNTETLREVVELIQTNIEQRITTIEARAEARDTLFSAHIEDDERIRRDIDRIEEAVQALLRERGP